VDNSVRALPLTGMKRFLFPVLLIMLAIAVYILYTDSLYAELKYQLAKEVEVKAAVVEAEKAQVKLEEIKRRYESLPPDADEKLAQLLPETVDPIKLLIDASAFLERNGYSAKTVRVSYDDAAGGGSYRKHKISFSISASYDMFREFLHELESSLMLRDTSRVSFTVVDSLGRQVYSRPEHVIHTYNVEIIGYSLR